MGSHIENEALVKQELCAAVRAAHLSCRRNFDRKLGKAGTYIPPAQDFRNYSAYIHNCLRRKLNPIQFMVKEFDRVYDAGYSSDAPRLSQLTSYHNYNPSKLAEDFNSLATIAVQSSEQGYKLYKTMQSAGLPGVSDSDLIGMGIEADDLKLDVIYLWHLINVHKVPVSKNWLEGLKTQAYVSYLTAPKAYAKVMGSRLPNELTRRPTFEHWPIYNNFKPR